MATPNILPSSFPSVPSGPEFATQVLGNPNQFAMAKAPGAINAAGLGLSNVLTSLSPLPMIAGIGFLTWLGADMICGGLLGNPATPTVQRYLT